MMVRKMLLRNPSSIKHFTGKDMLIYVQQAHGTQGSYKQREKEAGAWSLNTLFGHDQRREVPEPDAM